MSRRSFDGAVVVVTGAAGGLGRELARSFAKAGAVIVALDRDTDGLDSLAQELAVRGTDCATFGGDVADEAYCRDSIGRAAARLGRIDVLVNNAGVSHRSAFEATRLDVLRRVMDVNFWGAVCCTQAALPHLRRSHGLVIAISSVAGFAPLIARTGYSASKHALHGFFESLRTELAPDGVHVMMVCPSFVATGIDRSALGPDGAPARHAQVVIGARQPAQAVAARILGAAARNERTVLIGRTARLAWWLSRLAPRWYERAMARRLRGELAE